MPTLEESVQLLRLRLRHAVALTQPLVLVADPAGSTGRGIARRLAGHPDCHVDPGLIEGSFPHGGWPRLGPGGDVDSWLAELRPEKAVAYFVKTRSLRRLQSTAAEERAMPPLLSLAVQEAIFRQALEGVAAPEPRAILDAWWTGLFNAWLDYRGLRGGPRRWILAVVEDRKIVGKAADGFWDAYPDGRLVLVPGSGDEEWQAVCEAVRSRRPEQVVRIDAAPAGGPGGEALETLCDRLGLGAPMSLEPA